MARRRMFSLDIVDTDRFLDLPTSTQALYFHLGMKADDDGFVGNPRRIARCIGASDVDLNLLCERKYIIPFESGVIVITHFKMQNTFKNDRYKPTIYKKEKSLLKEGTNKEYLIEDSAQQFFPQN